MDLFFRKPVVMMGYLSDQCIDMTKASVRLMTVMTPVSVVLIRKGNPQSVPKLDNFIHVLLLPCLA